MESINRAFCTKILSILQRQAVINLIEKKDCDKRYFKNWKPISLLNVNKKHFSKAISKKIRSCFANVNFLTTNCVCKKHLLEKVVD